MAVESIEAAFCSIETEIFNVEIEFRQCDWNLRSEFHGGGRSAAGRRRSARAVSRSQARRARAPQGAPNFTKFYEILSKIYQNFAKF